MILSLSKNVNPLPLSLAPLHAKGSRVCKRTHTLFEKSRGANYGVVGYLIIIIFIVIYSLHLYDLHALHYVCHHTE